MSCVEVTPGSGISAKYLALQGKECPICLDEFIQKDFQEKTIHKTACDHFFHTACIDACRNKQVCPLCIQTIDTEKDKECWKKIVAKIRDSESFIDLTNELSQEKKKKPSPNCEDDEKIAKQLLEELQAEMTKEEQQQIEEDRKLAERLQREQG
jgi:hypothetical protein